MHWIVQENICQEKKWGELISSLERLDVSYSIHKVVPFSGELIPDSNLPKGSNVFAYGSISLGNVCKEKGWIPGVIELPNFIKQRKHWGDRLLNHDAELWSLGMLAYARLPDTYGDTIFVRPIDDSKFIKGQLMTKEELYEWARKVVCLREDDGSGAIEHISSELMVSKPKKLLSEARFWIVDGRVVTYSTYKIGRNFTQSRMLVDQDMICVATALASPFIKYGWEPERAYCLDLCRTEDNQIKIVEINNINSSGLYDCDTQVLVSAIHGVFSKC